MAHKTARCTCPADSKLVFLGHLKTCPEVNPSALPEQTSVKPTVKRDPLADIAPYPRTTEQATAGALIKHYTAFGEMHSHLTNHFPDGDQFTKSIGCVVSSFTAVYLLTEIREQLGVDAADYIARDLWEALEGGALPPWLWDWVDEEGLDHNQIAAAADAVAANIRAKSSSASLPLGEEK